MRRVPTPFSITDLGAWVGGWWPLLTLALLAGAADPGAVIGQEADEDPRFPDVPFVVTPMPVVDAMLELAAPTAADSLFDLGSGDGRIPILAAARYGTPSVGIELQDTLVTISRSYARRAGVGNLVRFVPADLFDADLRPATVVTLYLFTTVNLRLRPKLLGELRPGARVVSHHFGMGDWEPDSTVSVPGHNDPVHFWVVPANVSGRWEVRSDGEEIAALDIEQRYQEIRPRLVGEGPDASVEDARLRGDSVHLVLRRPGAGSTELLRLDGTASGDRIGGVTSEGERWTARRVGGRRPLDPGVDEGATPSGQFGLLSWSVSSGEDDSSRGSPRTGEFSAPRAPRLGAEAGREEVRGSTPSCLSRLKRDAAEVARATGPPARFYPEVRRGRARRCLPSAPTPPSYPPKCAASRASTARARSGQSASAARSCRAHSAQPVGSTPRRSCSSILAAGGERRKVDVSRPGKRGLEASGVKRAARGLHRRGSPPTRMG